MCGVVGAQAAPHGVGEDPAQEPDRAGCCRASAGNPRQTAFLCCLGFASGSAFGYVVKEPLDVLASDGSNGEPAQEWLDVALDAAFVHGERAGLLWRLAAGQESASLSVGEVPRLGSGVRIPSPAPKHQRLSGT